MDTAHDDLLDFSNAAMYARPVAVAERVKSDRNFAAEHGERIIQAAAEAQARRERDAAVAPDATIAVEEYDRGTAHVWARSLVRGVPGWHRVTRVRLAAGSLQLAYVVRDTHRRLPGVRLAICPVNPSKRGH